MLITLNSVIMQKSPSSARGGGVVETRIINPAPKPSQSQSLNTKHGTDRVSLPAAWRYIFFHKVSSLKGKCQSGITFVISPSK